MKARDQRRAIAASVRAMRREAREKLDRNPAIRKERRRRRIRRAVTLAVLLILASLIRCECGPGKPKGVATLTVLPLLPKPPVAPKAVTRPKAPLHAHVASQARGAYATGASAPPPWLDAFRLQVAARSPRLAKCFTGQDRPGALRWTSSVNPKSGAVSDHELELIGSADELRREQKLCLEGVLNAPRYLFENIPGQALPSRISMVIEF